MHSMLQQRPVRTAHMVWVTYKPTPCMYHFPKLLLSRAKQQHLGASKLTPIMHNPMLAAEAHSFLLSC